MRILTLSMDHRTAAMAVREAVALNDDAAKRFVQGLKETFPLIEVAALSTCNRTELYVARPTHEQPDGERLRSALAAHAGMTEGDLAAVCVLREQHEAVSHLFRVACGVESLVTGEVQVLGKVRRAYERAAEAGTIGGVLHPVFQQAIATAKRVHAQTHISRGQHSVGSVAVQLAEGIFDQFHDKRVLAIGAGDVSETVLRRLAGLKPKQIIVCNRSVDRAMRLTQNCGIGPGSVRPFEELDRLMVEADIILTATGADRPIIDVDRFKPVVKQRRRRPVCLIDLALPRDIAPQVGGLSNVYLYNIDDLQAVVAQTHEQRRSEIDKCNAIITPAVDQCMKQVQHRDVGVMIKHLRHKLHTIGKAEQERTLKRLKRAVADGDEAAIEQVLDQHTTRLINKVLHMPLSALEKTDGPAPLGFYAGALRRLFELPDQLQAARQEAAAAESPDDSDDSDDASESDAPEQQAAGTTKSVKEPAR